MPSNRRTAETEAEPGRTDGLRVLKKYPNRRLYDTRTSSYITLSDVKQMVLEAQTFEVRDAKSGEDLTRSIYGHTMQGLMGAYLEKNLQGFVEMHRNLSEQTGGLYEGKAFTPEAWTQFMSGQNPVIQNMMSGYLDQSRLLMNQMQEQMQKQAESFFPGMSGFTPPKG